MSIPVQTLTAMSLPELRALNKQVITLIKVRNSLACAQAGAALQAGMQVEFTARGEDWVGKLEGIGPKNCKVLATSRQTGKTARWTVPSVKVKPASAEGEKASNLGAPNIPALAKTAIAGLTAGQKAALTRKLRAAAQG